MAVDKATEERWRREDVMRKALESAPSEEAWERGHTAALERLLNQTYDEIARLENAIRCHRASIEPMAADGRVYVADADLWQAVDR